MFLKLIFFYIYPFPPLLPNALIRHAADGSTSKSAKHCNNDAGNYRKTISRNESTERHWNSQGARTMRTRLEWEALWTRPGWIQGLDLNHIDAYSYIISCVPLPITQPCVSLLIQKLFLFHWIFDTISSILRIILCPFLYWITTQTSSLYGLAVNKLST